MLDSSTCLSDKKRMILASRRVTWPPRRKLSNQTLILILKEQWVAIFFCKQTNSRVLQQYLKPSQGKKRSLSSIYMLSTALHCIHSTDTILKDELTEMNYQFYWKNLA